MARSITAAADERPRRVVDQDDAGVGRHRGEAFGDRILAPRPAGDDALRRRRSPAPARRTCPAARRRQSRSTRGCASKAAIERSSSVRPPIASHCLGTPAPSRVPCPPAAMITETLMRSHGDSPASVATAPISFRRRAPSTRSAVSATARRAVGGGRRRRHEQHEQDARRRRRHRRAQRVRGRVAERALGVDQRQPAGDVDAILADAVVALALGAEPQRQRIAGDAVAIVDAERDLRLDRAPVAEIDDGVDARQRVAAPHAPQQRLGRRPRLGRIEADGAIQRARPLQRPRRARHRRRAAALRPRRTARRGDGRARRR